MLDEFAPLVKKVRELQDREERAVESILENERLTADLDDAAAQVLLDWGVVCARRIVRSTAALTEAKAEEAMYPRLRATRRLMRGVNRWAANRRVTGAEMDAELLAQIVEEARIIYGRGFMPPDSARQAAFLRLRFEYGADPAEMVARLRELIGGPHWIDHECHK